MINKDANQDTCVASFGWYFLIKIGWGTGSRPTSVLRCRKLKIFASSPVLRLKQRQVIHGYDSVIFSRVGFNRTRMALQFVWQ
jgi:hypothetical protein